MTIEREDLRSTDLTAVTTGRRLAPIHPGEVEAQFWMNLRARYDLEVAERESQKRIEREVTPLEEAA
jgi:plasmid maintenance system antidote protein VapI